jgi:uncharacterized protein
MLLVVSIEDRKARIELGAGWMGQKNEDAQGVMDQMIIPQFKAGNYSEGIMAGVRGMRQMVDGVTFAQPTPSGGFDFQNPVENTDPSCMAMCCAVPIAILGRFMGGGRNNWYSGGGGWSGGGGGGGGGGGFGGGSGGGGGASGSW